MTVCPRCAAPCAKDAVECSGCGVVLARARKRPEEPRASGPPPTSGAKVLIETMVVLVLLGGAVWAWAKYGRDAPDRSETEMVRSPGSPVAGRSEVAFVPGRPSGAGRAPSNPPAGIARSSALRDPGVLRSAPPLPTYSGWLTGAAGYEDALARQRESASPVLVYFFTDWCPYCKQFDASVAPSSDSRFLRVRVNAEAGGMDKQLAAKFGVRGYPSIFLLSRAGAGPVPIEDGVGREKLPNPSAYTESCKEQVVRALWAAGSSVPGPETPDLDRALQFDPDEGGLWQMRAAIRWKAGYRKSGAEDARRACSLGQSKACGVGG